MGEPPDEGPRLYDEKSVLLLTTLLASCCAHVEFSVNTSQPQQLPEDPQLPDTPRLLLRIKPDFQLTILILYHSICCSGFKFCCAERRLQTPSAVESSRSSRNHRRLDTNCQVAGVALYRDG